AVPDTFVGERRCGGLLGQRDGDGESVVLDQEDDRCLKDGGEVECLVEVALAGGAVTDEHHRYRVVATAPGCVRQTRSVQALCRERCALGGSPVLVGVVAAVPVTPQEGQSLDRIDVAGDQRHRVAVGREEPV